MMDKYNTNKINLLIIAAICFGVLFFSAENVHAAGDGCSSISGTVTLDSDTYSANVGSTFNVTVTLTGFSGTCSDSIQDYTTGSWATVPNTDLTDIDCNGVACTATSITNFTKTLKCEAEGTYSIRGTGYGGIIVSSASTITCNPSDSTPPTVSTLSPADGATAVAIDSNLVITFSEAVDAETGNINLYKTTGDVLVQAFNVTTDITGTGTSTITINPTSNLDGETDYYVKIDATAFDDAAGNSYAGIADTTTWNFTSADITAPTLSETTAIPTPTTDTTPDYTFSSTEAGTITYGGDCSSSTSSAVSGENTITLTTLSDEVYSNCTITVTDASNNQSSALNITSFTVAAKMPGGLPAGMIIQWYTPPPKETAPAPAETITPAETKTIAETQTPTAEEQRLALIAQIKQQLISLITQLIQMLTLQVGQMQK